MKIDRTEKFKLHVFVCCNERKDGTGCGFIGGQQVRDELRAYSKSADCAGSGIRVSQSGCLGRCDEGVAVVAYPRGEWVLHADAEGAKQWLLELKSSLK
jgi:(2Fe-2S) ferredoxin